MAPASGSRVGDDVLQSSIAHYVLRRASGRTLQREVVARLRVPPSEISCTRGSYELYWGPPKAWSYDEEARQVVDHDGTVVGSLLDQQIAQGPLPPSYFARGETSASRCATVVMSEVMEAIQSPANADAWFVLPSQFNGVEYASHRSIVEKVEEYMGDKTAGPRGQLAVHPAVGQFLLDNAANDDRPDGISAVDTLFPAIRKLMGPENHYRFYLANGYVGMPDCPEPLQASFLEALREALHCLRCLGMRGVPATGVMPAFEGLSEAEHRVNMIYASAVPVQAYMNKGNMEQRDFQEEVSRLLITAQYFGAFQLALAQGLATARVVALPLGGGIFNNSLACIAGAISDAIEWCGHGLPAGERLEDRLDVQVLMYKKNPEDGEKMTQLLNSLQKLRSTEGSS